MFSCAPRQFLVCIGLGMCCCAQSTDLTKLSLDDLAKVQITSASRKSESLSGAPAAIYVLTSDAIQQGGFTSRRMHCRPCPASMWPRPTIISGRSAHAASAI
jgi:hypothetical protein